MRSVTLARELLAMAQTGLHFTQDPYDRERYQRLQEMAAEIMESSSGTPAAEILNWSQAEFGYATPKVDVRAFILSEAHQILLIREDRDEGRWTLPGGWADVNETPSQSVIREVEEESGYQVRAKQLLAVLDREKQGHLPSFPFHVYKLFFHCEITGGAPRANEESSESGFFAVDALPELSVSRVLARQIQDFHRAVVQKNPTPQFD